MAIFDVFKNFTVVRKEELSALKTKSDNFARINNLMRPEDTSLQQTNQNLSWGINNLNNIGPMDIYELSRFSDTLINIFNTLKNEMFRGGFDIKPKAIYEVELQKKKIERVQKRANMNDQSLVEVFKEVEGDLDTFDDAYILARKEYLVNGYNEIIGAEVLEFLRLDPFSVEIVFDKTSRIGYDAQGQAVFFDPEKRTELTHKRFRKDGRENMRACYRVKSNSGGSYLYYDTSEILHISKFHPSKTYGYSPLYALYNKVITLINMDFYIKQYYSGNKVPKGILTVNTTNSKSFLTWWNEFLDKTRLNPHAINPLIHESVEGKDPIKWVDFMRNLQEMQYTEVRNEIRVQIGAPYNVSPIFQNDTSTGGGLNNEGLQITVTDRGIEMGQAIFNSKVLPWMADQLGITDYEWTLKPSKEIDEIHEKELRLKDIEIARATADLGLEVSMNDTGHFSFKEGKVTVKPQSAVMSDLYSIGKSCQQTAVLKATVSPPNKKDGIITTEQQKDIENALLTELEKLLKRFDTKTRPSKQELDKKIQEVVKEFDSVVKSKSSKKLKAIYQKAMSELGKEVGRTFSISDVDKNVIEALKREPVYQEAFANVSKKLSERLKQVVEEQYSKPEGISINDMVEQMREDSEVVESQLRTIARTESSKISMAARKVQYEKTGEPYKYYHIGPDDERTTEASKEIKQMTKNGVSWDEYVDIVSKVSKKFIPNWTVNPVAPISHPNSRHTFIARRA